MHEVSLWEETLSQKKKTENVLTMSVRGRRPRKARNSGEQNTAGREESLERSEGNPGSILHAFGKGMRSFVVFFFFRDTERGSSNGGGGGGGCGGAG